MRGPDPVWSSRLYGVQPGPLFHLRAFSVPGDGVGAGHPGPVHLQELVSQRGGSARPGLHAPDQVVEIARGAAPVQVTIPLLQSGGPDHASLVLVCCCPAGTISNSYTFISRGSTALSVALTAVSCLLATLATPAALWLFLRLIEVSGEALHVPAGPLSVP